MPTEPLIAWLGEHLFHLGTPAQLGIVCSGLALPLWRTAPAQLAPEDRLELLLEHLVASKQVEAFARGLLADETLGAEATRLGLAELVPAEQGSPEPQQFPSELPTEALLRLPIEEPAVQALLDAFDQHLASAEPLAAYGVLAGQLGGFAHLGCRLGRSRLLLELIRRLYPLVAPLSVGDAGWQLRYAQLLWWETEVLRMTGQLDAALVTTERQWPLHPEMLPGLWLRQAQIHRLAGRLKLASSLASKAQALSPDLQQQAAAAAEQASLALLSGDASLCLLHLWLSRSLLRQAGHDVREWPLRLALLLAQRALRMQDVTEARKWLASCEARAEESHDTLAAAETAVLLADALRRDGEHEAAAQAIAKAMHFASHSGAAEVLVAAGREQARLQMDLTRYEAAAAALGTALALAEELSLACYRIDLLNLRGQLHLRRSNPAAAERDARDALAHAMARECGYQWGEADSLHLLAVTLLSNRPRVQSLRHSEAITHLSDELELRDRMQDPTAPEVRWLIRRLRTVA